MRGSCCLGATEGRTQRMARSGRREGAEAIRERIGPDARYTIFVPPRVHGDRSQPAQQWPSLRWLWGAALLILSVVLVLAALVVLGF
jgi:hypothetical protein